MYTEAPKKTFSMFPLKFQPIAENGKKTTRDYFFATPCMLKTLKCRHHKVAVAGALIVLQVN